MKNVRKEANMAEKIAGHLDPHSIRTPKRSITGEIKVLHDDGDYSWSIVLLTWDGRRSFGVRWNGGFADNSSGNPQSRGFPTWFLIPDALSRSIAENELGKYDENIELGRDWRTGLLFNHDDVTEELLEEIREIDWTRSEA